MKNIRNRILLTFFIATIVFIPSRIVLAASASINFEVEAASYVVGDEIEVALILESDIFLGNFEGFISYDEDLLRYEYGPSCISGDDGLLKVNDVVNEVSSNTRKYVLTFVATKKGKASISMVSNPEIYELDTGYLMSTSQNTLEIEVNATPDASKEARLSQLKVTPGTLSPEFSSDIFEYEIEVGLDVESLIISAIPLSNEADTFIAGNNKLALGRNVIKIIVTAESSDEIEYVLYVYKQDNEVKDDDENEPSLTPEPTEQPEDISYQNSYKMSFTANKDGDQTLLSGSYVYSIVPLEDKSLIPDGYTKTSIIVNGISIPAYANKDEKQGEFLLLYLKEKNSEPCFYRYDRVEKTIQRLVLDSAIHYSSNDSNQISSEEIVQLAKNYDDNLSTMSIIIAIICGICAILLFGVIKLYLKVRSNNDDELS